DIYDAAPQPIADGDPALTRQAADATIEVLFFMACQVEGGGTISPAKAVKDEWAKKLAEAYDAMEPAARQEIADMPVRWAALRLAWPGLPEDKRRELKEQWGRGKEVQEGAAAITRHRQQTAINSGGEAGERADDTREW